MQGSGPAQVQPLCGEQVVAGVEHGEALLVAYSQHGDRVVLNGKIFQRALYSDGVAIQLA